MAITVIKSWSDGEQLTASDLNAEFDNLYANALNAATQLEVTNGTSTTTALTPNHNKLINGTLTAFNSAATLDFTGIPAGTRRIIVHFSGFSTSGTSNPIIQIGDAGGMETSAYLGAASTITTATPASANFTAGYGLAATTIAGALFHGTATMTLMDSATFRWSCTSLLGHSNATTFSVGAGSKALSAELTQIRITTVGGIDTIDAGSLNITYER